MTAGDMEDGRGCSDGLGLGVSPRWERARLAPSKPMGQVQMGQSEQHPAGSHVTLGQEAL